MIKRVIILGAIFFVLYNLCLLAAPFRDRFIVQSDAQENVAKAQEFLLGTHARPYVVVGSSLGARLTEERLGSDFYNLAFSGGSLFTGLELIFHRPGATKIVFIETNMILRGEDQAVLANALRPVVSELRHYLPALRERCQPANFVAGKVGEKIVAGAISPLQWVNSRVHSSNSSSPPSNLFASLLADQQRIYSVVPNPERLSAQISKLKSRANELEARGIRCVFVEMPTDASLTELPLAATVRTALFDAFPPARYHWIRPHEGRRYATTDGCHLTGEEAFEFANRLQTYSEQPL